MCIAITFLTTFVKKNNDNNNNNRPTFHSQNHSVINYAEVRSHNVYLGLFTSVASVGPMQSKQVGRLIFDIFFVHLSHRDVQHFIVYTP